MKIITILGTRPEIIKLASLLPKLSEKYEHVIIHTGQHYDPEMDVLFFQQLQLPTPKYNLHIGTQTQPRQGQQTALMIDKIEQILLHEKPNAVIVQGDTNTTLAGALAASKLHIPTIHIEAGCRSFNRSMPEEINRTIVDQISDILLPADQDSTRNLLHEGIPETKIHQVVNTIFHACTRNLQYTKNMTILQDLTLEQNQYILATIHRAENTQPNPLKNIVNALNTLSQKIRIIIPLHPRTKAAMQTLNLTFEKNITLLPPQGYLEFLTLLANCRICISDSGGIQDEALICNVPCLIPRYDTEWPRLVNAGKNFLIGNKEHEMIEKTIPFIENDERLNQVKKIVVPYETNVDESILKIIDQNILIEKKTLDNPDKDHSNNGKPLRIGIFAYNFKHKKTQEGILNLFLHNIPLTCIFAADPVPLKFYQSKIRVAPKDLSYEHPKDIAKRLHIPYHVVVHNSEECENLIKQYNLDLGIVLGARILKDNIIHAFQIGILNMHPGLLPENRGLDNLKWAILNNYKQGVSVHLIDKQVDKGNLIIKQSIPVYEDDTLVDIHLRLQSLEQQLMLESIKILASGKREFESVPEGNYRKAVPPEEEAQLLQKFEEYKKKYNQF